MTLRAFLPFTALFVFAGAAAQAQGPPQDATPPAQPNTIPLIKTETRLVLVDTVVTDKKGQYVANLDAKSFKVWEDNKEQPIKTFSFSADPDSPANNQKRYLVLFFDNSTMDFGEQAQARKAAGQFIDANTGPNRLVAIVNFGGALQITQNFTADAERLKQVVSGIKTSSVSPNGDPGSPRLGGGMNAYGARSVVMALRELAKNLADIPGRKSLIMLTGGFRLSDEIRSEVTAAIDMCNRSNVAVYPIDVRGLTTMPFASQPRAALRVPSGGRALRPTFGFLRFDPIGSSRLAPTAMLASFVSTAADVSTSMEYEEQVRGGGGAGGTGTGGTGGTGGGAAGGGRAGGGTGGGVPANPSSGRPTAPTAPTPGGTRGTPSSNNPGNRGNGNNNGGGGNINNPMQNPMGRNGFNLPRTIVPAFPPSALDNQQVLYMLAEGTGGFVIVNTNDLLGGLEKIGKEQNQYYVLGYTPPESAEGTCHTLKVKVDHGNNVRARTGYCNVKSVDVLAGKPVEKQLETRVVGTAPGSIAASMQAPYFYTSPGTARVDVAIEIPSASLKFEKVKGKFHAAMDVLGIAYRPNGDVAARFSDTVKFDLDDKKQVEQFAEKPLHYENQFDVASGQYTLKVAFTAGEGFGKLEAPLSIDPNDGKKFAISDLALAREIHKVSDLDTNMDSALLEGRAPLVAGPFQFTPTGAYQFKTSESPTIYFEVYEPAMTEEKPPQVGVQMVITERTSGKQEADSGMVNIQSYVKTGNPVIAAGLKLPVNTLKPGSYTVGIKAMNSTGNEAKRSANFEVQ
ncbi:MAG TPA: VWA domain-containing protein [Candidatus Acidoferrales bacterium]|nr:VWA domain-containing protein [Candidatus Acidoferrales bacterium]